MVTGTPAPSNLLRPSIGIFRSLLVSILALICIIPLTAHPCTAAVVSWIGGSGSNWSTAANWSGGRLPTSNDVAQFSGSGTSDVTINANVSINGLDVKGGYTGTITQAAGAQLTVGSTGILFAAGTFQGSDATIDCNGPFTMSDGTFRSTAGTFSVLRNLTISGGTFLHNTGTVTLDSYDKSVNVGSAVLNNLTIATGGNSVTTTGTLTLAGNLIINSVNYMNGGTIAVAGNVTSTDTALIGYPGTVILFNGTGNQALIAGVPNALVPSVNIDKPSGTLTITGPIGVFNHWTHTAGPVDPGTQPLQFVGFDKTIVPGSMTYGDVVFNTGGNSITTSGTMDVNGSFTIQSVNYMSGGAINVAGNVTTNDTALIGYPGTVIRFDGAGDQTLTAGVPNALVPTIDINKTGGTLTIAGPIGVFNHWTHTAGNVEAGSQPLRFVGFDKTITPGTMSYGNVEISTGGNSVTVNGPMDVNGSFTLTSVNYFQGGTIYVAGDLSAVDSSVQSWNAVTLVLDGEGDQTIDTNGGAGKLPRDITINKSRCVAGSVKLNADLVLNQYSQDLIIAEGTLDLQGHDLTVNGSAGKLIIESGGILRFDAASRITTNTNCPELRCGSMVKINDGGTYFFPSNTASDVSGLAGNSGWTIVGSCAPSDSPSDCESTKTKIVKWREVRNSSS